MKPDRLALPVSILALALAAWSAYEARRVRKLDDASRALLPAQSQAAAHSIQETNLEQRLTRLEAASPALGTVMSALQLHFAKLHFAG
jgi:hypothetical protein